MAFRPRSWLKRMLRQNASLQWEQISRATGRISGGRMRYLREEAATLRRALDRFMLQVDGRMAVARAELSSLPLPGGTDWRWRPELLAARVSPTGLAAPAPGSGFGAAATIWHDCDARAVVLRQLPNADAGDLALFGMRLETLGFTGSFLSLALDLPEAALDGLTRNHILRFETAISVEREADLYLRLNIGNGPNTEEMLRHLGGLTPGRMNSHVTEFDLALTEMNEKRLDKIWLDLIVERPVMNAVHLREMIVSRHPRANV